MPYKINQTDIRSIQPNPPLFFANTVATGPAGGGTAMSIALTNIGVSLGTIGALREGVLIKNMSGNTTAFIDIFGTSGDSGGNKKYSIGGLDEVFIGCTNPANFFIKNAVAGAGITFGVYGR